MVHKKNGGASSARNAGLNVAKGNWIAFADSDDWLEITALETLYDLAIKYDVPMAIGGMVNAKGEEGTYLVDEKLEANIQKFSQTDLLNRFFRVNGEPDTHSVCATLIRRDILEDYHFIEGKMNEDVEACYYLARKCEGAVYTNKPVYFYFKNVEGARFTLLTQMNLNGYDHNDPFMIETKKRLKYELRKSFWQLMKWNMPLSRKVLLMGEII